MVNKGQFSWFVLASIVLVATIVAYRYYGYITTRDFLIDVYAPCDPLAEQCFESDCASTDDFSCPTGPYKKIEIRESDAPNCLEEHTCSSFSCSGISSCTVTYCSSDSLEDGESCSASSEMTSGPTS